MTKPNRFASLIEAAQQGPEPVADATISVPIPVADDDAGSGSTAASNPPALPQEAPGKGVGRPRGKRSHPDFEQVSAYLPSALYARVRIALIEDKRPHEFSDVVAELLSGWLDRRQAE